MEEFETLYQQLSSLNQKIDQDFKQLSSHIDVIHNMGAEIRTDLSIIPSSYISNGVVQNVETLGNKLSELIKEQDVLNRNFIKACDKKYKELIQKGRDHEIMSLNNLIQDCNREAKINLYEAIKNFKNKIDLALKNNI